MERLETGTDVAAVSLSGVVFLLRHPLEVPAGGSASQ